MTGEDYFQIGLRLLEYPDEAKKYFKAGAELYHSKCTLKLAEITQDEFYYELAADFGESEAIRWVIKKLIAEKKYEAALTKLDDYAKSFSLACEGELRDELTFKMLDDKWTAGTISPEEMITLADLYERGKGTEQNPQKAKFIKTLSAAKVGNPKSMFELGNMYLDGEKKNISEAKV